MNVPNTEKKAFRDMTAEERSVIVETWLITGVDHWSENTSEFGESFEWRQHDWKSIRADGVYRTKPRKLIIPWEHIKPKFRWAAMDQDGEIFIYELKPHIGEISWSWEGGELTNIHKALNIDTSGIDWRESLTQRPEN